MKEIKTNESQAREKYEPMEIEVVKVTPQGILCQSSGTEDSLEGATTGWF